jgi:ATP-independent RNA helicase DbpA
LTQSDFSSLQLNSNLLTSVASLGYESMTPIQAQSLPHILAGEDIIGQAKTGSGKTAAFALGLLEKLEVERYCIQSLVLCPTRELADQVTKEIRKIARTTPNVKVLTLCGGVPGGTYYCWYSGTYRRSLKQGYLKSGKCKYAGAR